jgi:hypothetical protein
LTEEDAYPIMNRNKNEINSEDGKEYKGEFVFSENGAV